MKVSMSSAFKPETGHILTKRVETGRKTTKCSEECKDEHPPDRRGVKYVCAKLEG